MESVIHLLRSATSIPSTAPNASTTTAAVRNAQLTSIMLPLPVPHGHDGIALGDVLVEDQLVDSIAVKVRNTWLDIAGDAVVIKPRTKRRNRLKVIPERLILLRIRRLLGAFKDVGGRPELEEEILLPIVVEVPVAEAAEAG